MVAKKSRKRKDNSLKKVGGKMATDNPKQFNKIIEAVIHQWQLSEPVDIMIANRMVATWMKMRFAESCLEKFGPFFEERDEMGTLTRIKVNEIAYYLKQLEADFRAYYRLLQTKAPKGKSESTNFFDLISVEEEDD
jgi:hypothetical protein